MFCKKFVVNCPPAAPSTNSCWGVRLHIVPRQDIYEFWLTHLSDSPARSSGSHSGVRLHIVRRGDSRRWLCCSRRYICRGRCTNPGCHTYWRIDNVHLTSNINIIITPDSNFEYYIIVISFAVTRGFICYLSENDNTIFCIFVHAFIIK